MRFVVQGQNRLTCSENERKLYKKAQPYNRVWDFYFKFYEKKIMF